MTKARPARLLPLAITINASRRRVPFEQRASIATPIIPSAKTRAITMAKRKSDAQVADLTSSSSTSTKITKSTLIDDLNALDHDAFKSRFFRDASTLKYEHNGTHWNATLYFGRLMCSLLFEQCFKLIETTSRHDYEPSSFGWHPRLKQREMREPEMRYLRVEKTAMGQKFGGFVSFMFTHDSTPAVPVLYIYEIHLAESARGKGLGGFLMRMVENVAREAGVEKVMLTCFLSNENALAFYHKLGFEVDACSPGDRRTRNKVVKADYVIMSKNMLNEGANNKSTAVEVTQAVPGGDDCSASTNMAQENPPLNAATKAADAQLPIEFNREFNAGIQERLKCWKAMTVTERQALWQSMAQQMEIGITLSDIAPPSSWMKSASCPEAATAARRLPSWELDRGKELMFVDSRQSGTDDAEDVAKEALVKKNHDLKVKLKATEEAKKAALDDSSVARKQAYEIHVDRMQCYKELAEANMAKKQTSQALAEEKVKNERLSERFVIEKSKVDLLTFERNVAEGSRDRTRDQLELERKHVTSFTDRLTVSVAEDRRQMDEDQEKIRGSKETRETLEERVAELETDLDDINCREIDMQERQEALEKKEEKLAKSLRRLQQRERDVEAREAALEGSSAEGSEVDGHDDFEDDDSLDVKFAVFLRQALTQCSDDVLRYGIIHIAKDMKSGSSRKWQICYNIQNLVVGWPELAQSWNDIMLERQTVAHIILDSLS